MERYDPKRMELSTRDVVARAIYTEVREGRGSPRGGVFLDVSHLPADDGEEEAAEHVRPVPWSSPASTSRAEPMEVGPTCHYIMGGISRRRRDGRRRPCPGCSPPASARGGMNGANRLGGNSLSDLLVFGKRTGERAAAAAGRAPAPVDRRARCATRPPSSTATSTARDDDPYALHAELQTTMQDNVGIYRDEVGLQSRRSASSRSSRARRAREGARAAAARYNPGWHLCRDLRNMLSVARGRSRARRCCARRAAARTAGSTSRSSPTTGARHNIVARGRPRTASRSRPVPVRHGARARRARLAERKAAEAAHEHPRVPGLARRRERRRARRLRRSRRARAWSSSTRCSRSSARRRRTSPCAGTARRRSAARAAPRSTAVRSLMCKTRLDELPDRRTDPRRADADVPDHPRPRHRRLLELRGEQAASRRSRPRPTRSG